METAKPDLTARPAAVGIPGQNSGERIKAAALAAIKERNEKAKQ